MDKSVNTLNNEHQVRWPERLSYGASNFACCLSFGLIGNFLMYFYTDAYGISAAAVGTLFLVARVIDAFNGPFWGILIDHTHTRWGKSRPYWLWFSIPYSIFCVLVFTTPHLNLGGKILWAYITYIGVDVLYSGVNIPLTSILPNLTSNANERVTLSTISALFATAGSTLISVIALPLVKAFGQGNNQKGFFWLGLILAFLSCIILLNAFFNTRERVQSVAERRSLPIKTSLKALKGNWPWAIIVFIDFVYWIGMQTRNQVTVYFFKYNMHAAWLTSIMLGLGLFGSITVAVTPWFSKRIGKRNTMMVGWLVSIAGQLVMWVGAKVQNVPIIIAANIIVNLGLGFISGLIAVMLADAVDYGEWKNGVRAEGIITAFSSFGAQLGMGLGGAITGWVLALGGYVANQAQTQSALNAITWNYVWIPIMWFGLSAIALLFYHVDSFQDKMEADLRAKHAREEAASKDN